MKELQGQAERLRRENDQLRAQIEKNRDLGKDARDRGHDAQLIARDKGKGLVALDNVETPVDDELSLGNFPSLNLSLAKNTRESTRTRSSRGLRLTLTLTTLLVVHLVGQGKRQGEDNTSQVKP